MIVARPGQRGPFTTHDLPPLGAYAPHADTPHAALLARAAAAYTLLPPDDERRRIIEYATGRLHGGDDTTAVETALTCAIRPRTPGAFS